MLACGWICPRRLALGGAGRCPRGSCLEPPEARYHGGARPLKSGTAAQSASPPPSPSPACCPQAATPRRESVGCPSAPSPRERATSPEQETSSMSGAVVVDPASVTVAYSCEQLPRLAFTPTTTSCRAQSSSISIGDSGHSLERCRDNSFTTAPAPWSSPRLVGASARATLDVDAFEAHHQLGEAELS